MNDSVSNSVFEGPNSHIGRSLSRTSARRTVAGRGRYTDDISLPRTVHAAFVRSTHAHARIIKIDAAEAQPKPGVVLIMTGAELAERSTGPWIGTLSWFEGMKSAPQFAMAVDRACWQGEPVVMVVAESRALAEDACEQVAIEWEVIPPTTEAETALDANTPVLHPDLGDNLAFTKTIDRGAVDDAFASADIVLKEDFSFGRSVLHALLSYAAKVVPPRLP